MKKLTSGIAKISAEIEIEIKECFYDEYSFLCFSVPQKRGCIISLPFFNYDKDGNQIFKGYLIYHDKESYGLSEAELKSQGLSTVTKPCPAGTLGELYPLPYKFISVDQIESAVESLIQNNVFIDISNKLFL